MVLFPYLKNEAHCRPALCPDGVYCCPVGDTCTLDGCCNAGEQQCGSSHCYNPSTSICCPDGGNCPKGQDCVGTFQCCPAGEQLCGDSSCYNPATEVCCLSGAYAGSCTLPKQCCGDDHCYDPATHKCCGSQGSCLLEDSCCKYECCRSVGYCGDDGFCEANTCTATSTSRTTSYYTFTTTITKVVEAEEQESAPEFVCPPLTATNNASATLELGDDCSLTFYPPPTDASSTSSPFSAAPSLKPRANAVDCLITSTSIVRYTVHTQTTSTTTVTETTIPEDFSCAPMTVTNVVGDELTLDEECKMEFSPGSSDSSPSSTSSATEGSSTGTSSGGGGASGGARSISCYGMLLGLPFLFTMYAYVV